MNLLLIAATAAALTASPNSLKQSSPKEVAVTCFKTGEQSSGMNKICYYDCLGSASAITIGAVELCPLTIND